MVLEGANSPFGGISSMDSRRYQLVIDGFVRQKRFQNGGAFVIEAV